MEQKLCWRCKEYFVNKYGTNYYQPPSSHCHHDEPEEKQKCWCDDPLNTLYRWAAFNNKKVKFCPECGKKLETP